MLNKNNKFTFSKDTNRKYLLKGASLGNVYSLAEKIRRLSDDLPQSEGPLCLFSTHRAVVAASCVASITKNRKILLPYSMNERVLSEVSALMPICGLILDKPIEAAGNIPSLQLDLDEGSSGAPTELIDFEEDFLFLFTGGSTGNPVLWSKTLGNIFNEVLLLTRMFEISPDDIILSTVPPLHIYGLLFTVLLPLVSGAQVVNEASYFPQEVFSAIEKTGATVLVGTPAHYRVLRTESFPNHSLRLAFSSGGALESEDAIRFHKMSGIGITEVYGSTETGGIAMRCIATGQKRWRSFPGIECKEISERLYVRSSFASKEMHRDQEGYCRTGDRVQIDSDGGFVLKGRADGIVKVGGKRVDMAEIEEKMQRIEGVNDVHVFSMKNRGARENQILVLVAGAVEEGTLKEEMADMFEPYALPKRIKVTDQIPTTPSGKRDRRAILDLFI